MLTYNYHTHTIRCGHASGTDEEYVKSAIANGYKLLGFSDHISYMNFEQNENYIQDILKLKEKYKNQIDIKVAFECEYVEEHLPYLQQLKNDPIVDYLIFGNHFTYVDDKKVNFCMKFDDVSTLDLYYETLNKALESKLFKYICHPDCFFKGYGKWDKYSIELAHKIAKLLSEYDVYVELSGSGSRSRSYFEYEGKMVAPYPFKEFFKILSHYPLKFVLGADAHAPNQLNDFATDFIKDMAKELNLNVIDILDL